MNDITELPDDLAHPVDPLHRVKMTAIACIGGLGVAVAFLLAYGLSLVVKL